MKKTYSTPTKRDSRSLDNLSWGDIGDYYPPEERTPTRVAAWERDAETFDRILAMIAVALETDDESSADVAIGDMRAIEMRWGNAPMADRAAEIVGVHFAVFKKVS